VEIRRLDWDSEFFGLEVFGVYAGTTAAAMPQAGPALEAVIGQLRQQNAGLAYFFLPEDNSELRSMLQALGAKLYDEKVTYGKRLAGDEGAKPGGIEEYEGPCTDELLNLAYLAGHESRFKKDPRLSAWFEPLYKLWMVNSLNGAFADKVFVYRDGDSIRGMVTCKVRPDGTGSIGLIASTVQGKGVGKWLVQAADAWFQTGRVGVSTVVTQKSNVQACRFYERTGFSEYKTEYVYHLWFN